MTATPDYKDILGTIHHGLKSELGAGESAAYIPELAEVETKKFGMALQTVSGETFTVGDADEAFSIQSISKLFSLTLAYQTQGGKLWYRVGREPSGTPFNSLVQLEYENGIPRNPFINAGALVVTDTIYSEFSDATQCVLNFVRRLADKTTIHFDPAVATSEYETGYLNIAMANLMKSFGSIENDVEPVINAYFHHCSIEMSCAELARACYFLANDGIDLDGQAVLNPRRNKRINALMMTCGTYDAAGDVAYRVGLPCKSGVGGGIVGVLPGQFSVCVWSPGLDKNGNSLLGIKALEALTTKTKLSVF